MPNHTASIQLCVQKLRILIEDSDQNLKYLGLLAMSKILKTRKTFHKRGKEKRGKGGKSTYINTTIT